MSFYLPHELKEWEAMTKTNQYSVEYYNGLASLTSAKVKEYFSSMEHHRFSFKYNGPEDDKYIDMAFGKNAVNQRMKKLLLDYMDDCHKRRRQESNSHKLCLYTNTTKAISYTDFIKLEFVPSLHTDNIRSIPSMIDGLTPGQRKILHTCIKCNDNDADMREVKVATLAVSVIKQSAYYCNKDQLLYNEIINLAANFVGSSSSNINLLMPIGQFGSRLFGGKDAGLAHHIKTIIRMMINCCGINLMKMASKLNPLCTFRLFQWF